jgi:urocanate hydratase
LTLDPPLTSSFEFVAGVARAYAALVVAPHANRESGLGGKLFYTGDLDEAGRALVVAANIAGAATLVATADSNAQKQAVRDGVADFAVTTLDEALRILKNQLRKRETVAVCVALAPSEVEKEMNERGVAPDLLRRDLRHDLRISPIHQALLPEESEEAPTVPEDAPTEPDPGKTSALITWRVDSALPKDLARLDEIALSCLDPEEWKSRRWLRLSPRYLGRLAQGLRLLDADCEFSARFIDRVRQSVEQGEIAFAVEIVSYFRGRRDEFRFAPAKP